jgi:hypothetical protein
MRRRQAATFCHSLTRLERHPIVGFTPATGHSIGEKERCSIGLSGRNAPMGVGASATDF